LSVELYLVRHAIAYERNTLRWPDDAERPLTPDGEERFRRAARGLARVAGGVDLVLSSPFVRAWQTAVVLSEEAGWPAPVECPALEPDRSPDETLKELGPHADRDSVALVGHEPHLSALIALLVTGHAGGDAFGLKKGGAFRLSTDGLVPGEAALRWALTPRIERSIRG
jgi:phosphohistidine phosphatase